MVYSEVFRTVNGIAGNSSVHTSFVIATAHCELGLQFSESSVGIETGYGLDGRDLILGRDKRFFS
jgi:hypothetical protein